MLICWNAEGVHGKKKFGKTCARLIILEQDRIKIC